MRQLQRPVSTELDSGEPKGVSRKSRHSEARAIKSFLRRAQTASILSIEDMEELEDELDNEHEA